MTTLLLTALLALDAPPLPSAATVRAAWLADLDPARVAELAVPGPPSAQRGQWQSFSLPVPLPAATLSLSGAEV